MKKSIAFPGIYFKAQHMIDGGNMTLTITGVSMEVMPGKHKEEKPVLAFKEDDRGLVLNGTNWDTIADCYGDDSDGWFGKTIELYAAKTEFGSKVVDCIRVRIVPFNDPIPGVEKSEPSTESPDSY